MILPNNGQGLLGVLFALIYELIRSLSTWLRREEKGEAKHTGKGRSTIHEDIGKLGRGHELDAIEGKDVIMKGLIWLISDLQEGGQSNRDFGGSLLVHHPIGGLEGLVGGNLGQLKVLSDLSEGDNGAADLLEDVGRDHLPDVVQVLVQGV